MKIKLLDISGEFCGRRSTVGLPELRKIIRDNIILNTKTIILTEGVKSITPSYIDELLPPLMIELGKDKVLNLVEFEPPLQGFAKDQIERGYQIRLSSNR